MNKKQKKRQKEAVFTIRFLQRQGIEIFLWDLVYYSENDICAALEDTGYVWAANFQRWMKQEELGL